MINGRKASADGPIKTFPLRGIKDSPPYLHDDRLLTLDDTVEFFNLVLELKLNGQEKKDLVAFLQSAVRHRYLGSRALCLWDMAVRTAVSIWTSESRLDLNK